MAEIITKDRKEYNIFDKVNKVWHRLNFLTNAKSVDFDDGKTAQNKLGAINGITSDLSGESETVAASIKCVNQLNNSLTNVNVYVGDDEKLHFVDSAGADSVLPFSSESNYKITFSVTTMLNYSYPAISTGTITIQNGKASVSYGGGNTQAADDGHMGRTHAISVTSIEKI